MNRREAIKAGLGAVAAAALPAMAIPTAAAGLSPDGLRASFPLNPLLQHPQAMMLRILHFGINENPADRADSVCEWIFWEASSPVKGGMRGWVPLASSFKMVEFDGVPQWQVEVAYREYTDEEYAEADERRRRHEWPTERGWHITAVED